MIIRRLVIPPSTLHELQLEKMLAVVELKEVSFALLLEQPLRAWSHASHLTLLRRIQM